MSALALLSVTVSGVWAQTPTSTVEAGQTCTIANDKAASFMTMAEGRRTNGDGGFAENPPEAAVGYTVAFKDGTEDDANWTVLSNESLNENDSVILAYSGAMLVKSVKASGDEVVVSPIKGKANEWIFWMPASDVEVEVEYFTQEESAMIAAVVAAIDAIPSPLTIKLSTYGKVKTARDAYIELSDDAKVAVANYARLTAATAAFAPYEGGGSTLSVIADVQAAVCLINAIVSLQYATDKVHFIGHLESDATKAVRADDISGWSYKDYQSCPIWLARRSFLFFDGNTAGKYYSFGFDDAWDSQSYSICAAIGASHCNDAFVDGNVVYIDNGTNGDKNIHKLNLLTNTATAHTLAIGDWQTNPIKSTYTQLSGVCDYNETQYLAVAYDAKQSDESETIENPPTITDQYLRVYVVNKSDNTISETLLGNPDVDGEDVDILLDNEGNVQHWEGIFVQGATYVDGFLYVATNRYRTSARTNYDKKNAYGGIAVWVIDLARKTLVDKIIFDGDAFDPDGNVLAANNTTYGIGARYTPGDFEPEGIDYVRENGVTYLYMGLGRYQGITKLLKFMTPVAVDGLIDVFAGTIAYAEASKISIDAARAAVDALGVHASLIDDEDMAKLMQAERTYAELLVVAQVMETIDAIGTVEYTAECCEKIQAAKAAYDVLTATQRAFVTNAQTLAAAELAYADKAVEATTNYSKSVNIEQLTLDNGVMYDVMTDFIDNFIEYAGINALDTLNDLENKALRNEPYLGLKLKTQDAYIKVTVKKGSTLNVKLGAVKDALGVSINGTAQEDIAATEEGITFSFTAMEVKTEVVFSTVSGRTVVFKQIMIDEPIADVVLPEPGAYLITTEPAENGTATVDWADKMYRTPAGAEVTVTATPATGYELEAITVTGAKSNLTYEVSPDGKFTMPNEEVAVSASFKTVSGITAVGTDDNDVNCYDMNGRRLSKPTKGLYIENGRKVMIR